MIIQQPYIQILKTSGPPTSPAPGMDLDAANYSSGTWTDQGTLGFSPSQPDVPTRPVALADSGFKGRPGVQFSATQNLLGTSMPLANSRTKGTFMLAFRSDTSSPAGGAIFSTTQDQLALLADGRFSLNSADLDYGVMSSAAKNAMLSTSGGQIVTGIYDGTQGSNSTKLRLWRNLVEETLAYFAGGVSGASLPATTFAGGSDVFLGREAGGSGWAHTAMVILFWRGVALTNSQRQEWEGWLATTFFTKTTKYLVVSGDSNAIGSPSQTANPWPSRVQTALGWSGLTNSSGAGLLLESASAVPQISVRDDWHTAQPYIIADGTNDLAVNHRDLTTLQGYFNSMKAKLVGARYPIFAFTIPESVSVITGDDETTRLAYNAWLPTVPGVTVIDVATSLGSSTGANFEDDHLHLNNTGHNTVKTAVLAAFSAAGY